jgi:GxxExxY protein
MAIDSKYLHSETTDKILSCYYNVLKELSGGLPLDIYKRALALELESANLKAQADLEIKIYHNKKEIGSLVFDFVVNDCIVVSVVSGPDITRRDELFAKNQLRLSKFELVLILNFDFDPQHKRIVLTKDRK